MEYPSQSLVFTILAVSLGIFIVTRVALTFQRTGLATGLATVFLGQMLIGIVVDMLGLVGVEPVPFDLRRGLGLVVMAVAIVLLVLACDR